MKGGGILASCFLVMFSTGVEDFRLFSKAYRLLVIANCFISTRHLDNTRAIRSNELWCSLHGLAAY